MRLAEGLILDLAVPTHYPRSFEVYRDAEVHAAHMASSWVRESLPKSAALIEGRPRIRQYVSGGSQPVPRTVRSD
jgi:quinol monooxygenase YgiN